MKISPLTKVIRTVWYYKPEQLGWYVYYRLRKHLPISLWLGEGRLPQLKTDTERLNAYLKYAQNWATVQEDLTSRANAILAGCIEYAGEQAKLEDLFQKKMTNLSPLARYGLHSFDFLWDLCLAYLQHPDSRYSDFAKNCVREWIQKHPTGMAVSWEPYPTSYRIRYWILAMHLWQWDDKEILDSLTVQTKWLYKSIEYHLRANHVIQNLCGLIISSALLFPEYLPELLKKLEKELNEQILDDGGHYERCPMYHLHVLLDLLPVVAILDQVPEFLIAAVKKMVHFLKHLTLTDGDIPLFGDSVHGHFPPATEILQVATKYIALNEQTPYEKSLSFPQSGYYLFKNLHDTPPFEVVIRAGEAGPPYQLAHAHCDQLSYELLIDGRRVIVDSGIHGYAGSEFRQFQRSTCAHNSIYIEGEEQLEYWGTFRVARRGKTEVVLWERFEDGQLFAGKYHYFTGSEHLRIFYILPAQGILCWDWVKSSKKKPIYNLIHFHPSFEVKINNSFVFLYCDKIKLQIVPIEDEEIETICGCRSPMQGWYSERFSEVLSNPTIVLKKNSLENSLIKSGYWISFNGEEISYSKGIIQQWVEKIEKKILKKKW